MIDPEKDWFPTQRGITRTVLSYSWLGIIHFESKFLSLSLNLVLYTDIFDWEHQIMNLLDAARARSITINFQWKDKHYISKFVSYAKDTENHIIYHLYPLVKKAIWPEPCKGLTRLHFINFKVPKRVKIIKWCTKHVCNSAYWKRKQPSIRVENLFELADESKYHGRLLYKLNKFWANKNLLGSSVTMKNARGYWKSNAYIDKNKSLLDI